MPLPRASGTERARRLEHAELKHALAQLTRDIRAHEKVIASFPATKREIGARISELKELLK